MEVGECKVIHEEDGSAAIAGIKDGQIIFMREKKKFKSVVNTILM